METGVTAGAIGVTIADESPTLGMYRVWLQGLSGGTATPALPSSGKDP